MSTEIQIENASLTQLQETPIDRVLHIIDEGLVHLPSYRELYYRWERQQWRAQDINFHGDRVQWEHMQPEEQQGRLYGLSAFFQGEACVTDTLAPYVTAMPGEEMRIFLTTQLVDEARHTVFFARFFKEVLGIENESLEEMLAAVRQYVNPHLKRVLIDGLTEVANGIREEPANLAQLVQGVTLYHIIVEGTMALAGQRGILDFYRQNDLFAAFRGGFTAVARDESRHVVFGVKFLRDMLQRDTKYAMVIQATMDKYLPTAILGLMPSEEMIPRILSMQGDPWQTPRYALDSLRKKLKVIGLSVDLPSALPVVPPV